MDTKHVLTTFLQKKRRSLGMTQDQFAEFLEFPITTYKAYERGHNNLKPEVLDHISKKLGIKPYEMFLNGDIPSPRRLPLASEVIIDELCEALGVANRTLPDHVPSEIVELLKISPEGTNFESVKLTLEASVIKAKKDMRKDSI